ncbi:MAG: alcohol dehydrogenase catalytic domain-containing protein [Propionibacteriaceae bacterium]|jgi:threonine dehydrogenase-like Zn-dependent dehydrogenase|nr:alcohol dehydrogenase catalytic domain-containing protein [Propionibacteriaceae bacterium]
MTTQYAVQITAKDRVEINPSMPVPAIGPRQILLQIEACGICFSDTKLMHAFENHPRKSPIRAGITPEELAEIPTYRPGSDPIVPGHEPVARICQVGAEVTRYRVGQRMLVQTDYRHLPTAASNAALGYDFDGALEEYALVDERMVIDPVTDESYLIEVSDEPSASAVALIEPWACVETAYAWPERVGLARHGRLLVVLDDGCVAEGLEELVDAADTSDRVEVAGGAALPNGQVFDDIIYAGADAATVERLGPLLGNRGVMNLLMNGRRFDRDVDIDVGRVHYDLIRYVGTIGAEAGEGYSWTPGTSELRSGDHVAVIGAAGPMGLMHVVRAATSGVPGIQVDAIDVNDDRLARLQDVLGPIAEANGVPTRVLNSTREPLASSYSYVALMVPAPPLVRQAVGLAGPDAIINAFAGFAIGTMAGLDLNHLVTSRIYLVGTSGSRIVDMETVWGRLAAGRVDTNISLDAISGIAGVPAAIESVNNRTSQGKIMVYPALHDLGLIRLVDLPEQLPQVAAAMQDGRWTKQAEQELLQQT